MPVVTDYTALLSGNYWNGIEVTGKPVIVTYSFPTSAPAYDASVVGFTGATVASFEAFSAAEQTQARDALAAWAAACGLIFIEVEPGKGDINFQTVDLQTSSYAGAGGIAFHPFGDWNFFSYPSFQNGLTASGDVFMNSAFESGSGASATFDFGTLLHEIGHAIGLKHPTEVLTDFAANPPVVHDEVLASDDPTKTIMAEVGGTDVLKALDKQAAKFIYGKAGDGGVFTSDASGSNSVLSSWSWNEATQTLTQTGKGGDDRIRGSSVNDVINGLNGENHLFGLDGDDTLNGGNGVDFLFGGTGIDHMVGKQGNDWYHVDDAADTVVERANQGQDIVIATTSYTLSSNVEELWMYGSGLTGTGNSIANVIYGDAEGNDTIYGLSGDDYIVSGGGNDTIEGGNDDDAIYGEGGDDEIDGDNGFDYLFGGAGDDTIRGGNQDDFIGGGDDDDKLYGNNHNDTLYGDAGADKLFGGSGNDTLNGGTGNDSLKGDAGIDVFVFDTTLDATTNVDKIVDFTHGVDRIALSADIFEGLSIEPSTMDTLAAVNFRAGTAALDADDRIIYNAANGAISYDEDGVGGVAAIKFATVTAGLTVTYQDFIVLL